MKVHSLQGLFLGGLVVTASASATSAQTVVGETRPALPVAAPAEVGMSEAVLRAGVTLFDDAIAADDLKGVVVLVARHGKVVLHEARGWRNVEEQLPMEPDSLFRMASNTKPVIAAAVLQLAEKRRLRLTDNVGVHLDGWDGSRSAFVRIEHLLTHTSGLRIPTLFLSPLLERSDEHPNAPDIVSEAARFGEVGPKFPPGETYSYSNPGFNTLGAIVTVAAGKPLKEVLRESIYEPLGMVDSYNHEPDAPQERMCRVYRRRGNGWRVQWTPGDGPDVPFPRASGGMISTAPDYFRFLQAMLDGGEIGGARVLKEESVRAATRDQVARLRGSREGGGARYGFGWVVAEDGSFSHGGSDGTWAWVDPARGIVGIVFTQSPGGRNPRGQFRRVVEASCRE